MMYVKPTIMDCGKSESVIKGECGWGFENIWFDKTGAYHTTRRKMVECARVGFTFYYCCREVEACSSDSNEC